MTDRECMRESVSIYEGVSRSEYRQVLGDVRRERERETRADLPVSSNTQTVAFAAGYVRPYPTPRSGYFPLPVLTVSDYLCSLFPIVFVH